MPNLYPDLMINVVSLNESACLMTFLLMTFLLELRVEKWPAEGADIQELQYLKLNVVFPAHHFSTK